MEFLVGALAGITAFIVGLGIFGWLLPLACLAIIFPLQEKEQDVWAFIALGATFLFLYFLSGFNVLLAVRDHWMQAVAYFALFVGIGGGWCVYMWDRFTKDYSTLAREKLSEFIQYWKNELSQQSEDFRRDARCRTLELVSVVEVPGEGRRHAYTRYDINEAGKAALAELNTGVIPEKLLHVWEETEYASKPTIFNYKNKAMNWIMFWPWSMLTYFCTRFLRDLRDFIIEQFSGVFAAITNRHYAGMDDKYFK